MKRFLSMILVVLFISNSAFALNTYEPDKRVTRAEAVKIILDKYSIKTEGKKNVFKDVPTNHWANEYIATAYEKGYILGYGQKIFRPDKDITFSQWIAMLARSHKDFDKNLAWRDYLDFVYEKNLANPQTVKQFKRLIKQEFISKTFYDISKNKESNTLPTSKKTVVDEFIEDKNKDTTLPINLDAIVTFQDEGLKRFILKELKAYNGVDR